MKILYLPNVSIHIDSYKNQFINECATKNLTNLPPNLRTDGQKVFFVRFRRICVLIIML